jgi:uncharacterized protein YdeI (YjbR/CyaY-like superfamily)
LKTEVPELLVRDAAEWQQWLEAHHTEREGVRLVLARRGSTSVTRLTHARALEEALAFGWIDGQAAPRDGHSWSVRFMPRRARSAWSKRNTEIVERLLAEGRMQAAGIAEMERAKADGRWDAAYAGPAKAEVPPDLLEALDASPVAKENFGRLNSQNRYAILYRLQTARRAETRARHVAHFVAMLERGESLYPQRRALEPTSGRTIA